MIPRKICTFKSLDIKETGQFRAVFATMNVRDKDDDITLPGAFGEQQVIIASYNHGSWGSGKNALPAGKGRIFEQGNEAIVEGQFFLDTENGIETYKTVKNIGDLQEWSYSLPEIDFEIRMENGERIRMLKKIRVNEVAPVLMGAGENTRTLDCKSMTITDHFETVRAAVQELGGRVKSLGELRAKEGRVPSASTLQSVAGIKSELLSLVRELEEVQETYDAGFKELLRFEKIKSERRAICPVQN